MKRAIYNKGFLRIQNLNLPKLKMQLLAFQQNNEIPGIFVEMLDEFYPKKILMAVVEIKEFGYEDLMRLASSNDESLKLAIKTLHELEAEKLLLHSRIFLIKGVLIRTDGEVFLEGLSNVPISVLYSNLHDQSVYVVHKPYTMDMIIQEMLEADLWGSIKEICNQEDLKMFYEEKRFLMN